jgi:hypothetical protein
VRVFKAIDGAVASRWLIRDADANENNGNNRKNTGKDAWCIGNRKHNLTEFINIEIYANVTQ